MHQLAHKPTKALIVGTSGTGKTTFFLRCLANLRARARFVFDHQGELGPRLGLPAACWPEELAAQLRSGWVVYDPAEMFPGRLEAAWAFFCAWAFALAAELPGRKVLACDELQVLTGPFNLPPEFAAVLETGRRRGLDGVFVSQQPNLLHNRIRAQSTELICFRLVDALAMRWAVQAGLEEADIRALPDGHYLARNLSTGALTRGRIALGR